MQVAGQRAGSGCGRESQVCRMEAAASRIPREEVDTRVPSPPGCEGGPACPRLCPRGRHSWDTEVTPSSGLGASRAAPCVLDLLILQLQVRGPRVSTASTGRSPPPPGVPASSGGWVHVLLLQPDSHPRCKRRCVVLWSRVWAFRREKKEKRQKGGREGRRKEGGKKTKDR